MSIIDNRLKVVMLALTIPGAAFPMRTSDIDKGVEQYFKVTDEIENRWFNVLTAVLEGLKAEPASLKQKEILDMSLAMLKKIACLAWFLVFKEDYYSNAYLYVNGKSTLNLQDVPLNNFLDLVTLKQSIYPESNLGHKAEYKEKVINALYILDLFTHFYAKDYIEDTRPSWDIAKIIATYKKKEPSDYTTYHKGMVDSKVYMDYTAVKVPALAEINLKLLADPDYIADPIVRALERHYADAVRLAVEEGWCGNKVPTIDYNSIATEFNIWSLFNSAIRLRRVLPYTYKILIDKYAVKIRETMVSLCSFNRVEATHQEVTFYYQHDEGTTNVVVPIVSNNIHKME